MKQFVNPVFQPVDNSISISVRRTELPPPRAGQNSGPLPPEYEKIFSSQTDLSSRLNDSLINSFDNKPPDAWGARDTYHNNTLSITQVVDQNRFGQEIIRYGDEDSLLNSSLLGVFNTTSDKIHKGFQQLDSLYHKLGDVSSYTQHPKLAKTICDEELKAELRDQVYDLRPLPRVTAQPQPQPQAQLPSSFQKPQGYLSTAALTQPYETKSRFLSAGLRQNNEPKDKDTASCQSYLSPQQRQSTAATIKVPSPTRVEGNYTMQQQSQPQLRHSSFVNIQQPSQTQKKQTEVYYSQLVESQQKPRINSQLTLQFSPRDVGIPGSLASLSRNVNSPSKLNSPQRMNSPTLPPTNRTSSTRSDLQKPPLVTQSSYKSTQSQILSSPPINQVQQQKQLFDQAEQVIKFKRTQPQVMRPNWQKRGNNRDKNGSFPNDVGVLCVICEEYVQFENADKHSQICLAKSKLAAETQNTQSLIQNLNQKLESIKKSISSQQKQPQLDFQLHQEVLECLSEIILCQKNFRRLSQLTEQLFKIFQNYQQNFDEKRFIMTLLVQRAVSLSQEKCLKMQFLEKNSINNNFSTTEDETYLINELSRLEKQAEMEKANLETWKKEHDLMMQIQQEDLQNMKYLRAQYLENNLDNELLSQINSDWDFGKNQDIRTFKTQSVVSDLAYQREGEATYNQNNSKTNNGKAPSEELKKEFFSLAVQIKLNLPHNHPGKKMMLQDAYERAQELGIPKATWQKFLWEEFQRCRQ